MVRQPAGDEAVQLLYVGNSADMAALRRSMEAHGAVTRSRLSPAVSAVVADRDTPTDHPVLQAAHSIGVQVLEPLLAIDALPARRPPAAGRQRSWAPVIATLIAGLLAVLAVLGVFGSVVESDLQPRPVGVERVAPASEVAPGYLTPH